MPVLVHYLWLHYLRGKLKVLLECVNKARLISLYIILKADP